MPRGWSVVGPRASVLLNADRPSRPRLSSLLSGRDPPSPPLPRGGARRPVAARTARVLPSGCRCSPTTHPARGAAPASRRAGARRRGGLVRTQGERPGAGPPRGRPREPASPPGGRSTQFRLRPQIRRDDPLNLSILLSGGKETNQDSLSSGERRGKSPAPNPRLPSRGEGIVAYGRPPSLGAGRGSKSF